MYLQYQPRVHLPGVDQILPRSKTSPVTIAIDPTAAQRIMPVARKLRARDTQTVQVVGRSNPMDKGIYPE